MNNRLLALGPALIWLGLVLGLVLHASSSVTNADVFFHIRIGEHFLDGDWSLWHPGHFPFATKDWAPTQWLPQLVLALADRWFGLAGVAWVAGSWYLLLAAAVGLACRRHAPPLVSVVLTVFVVIACYPSLSGRPQILSYAFMALLVDAWMRTREDGGPRWWLIALTWLWAMCHGMWLLGVVTSFVACLGVLLARGAGGREQDPVRGERPWWQLALVPVGSAVAAALTPIGPKLYGAVGLVGSRKQIFDEWGPADYTKIFPLIVAILLGLLVLMLLRSPGPVDWFEVLLVLLCCAWAIYSARTVPIAAVTLAPLLARRLAPFTHHLDRSRREYAAALLVVAVGLAALGLTARQAAVIYQPRWVDPAVRALPDHTPVVADWITSGYFSYRYRNTAPLITGYADMYTDRELDTYGTLIDLRPGWRTVLRRYGATVALLPPSTPLAYALRTDQHWRVVHHDSDIEMLVAPTAPASLTAR